MAFHRPTKRSINNPKHMPRYTFRDTAPTYDARGGQFPSGAEFWGTETEGSGYTRSYQNALGVRPGDPDNDRRNLQLPGSDVTPVRIGQDAATGPTVPRLGSAIQRRTRIPVSLAH